MGPNVIGVAGVKIYGPMMNAAVHEICSFQDYAPMCTGPTISDPESTCLNKSGCKQFCVSGQGGLGGGNEGKETTLWAMLSLKPPRGSPAQ